MMFYQNQKYPVRKNILDFIGVIYQYKFSDTSAFLIFHCGFQMKIKINYTLTSEAVLCAFSSEGNGNPLQCSFLENPRDSGAWWAAVYGVEQSQPRLK